MRERERKGERQIERKRERTCEIERERGNLEREIIRDPTTIKEDMYSTPSFLCSCTGLPIICV